MAAGPLRPVAQTDEAFAILDALDLDGEVADRMDVLADRVLAVAPDCVAMSLSLVESRLTFTLVAEQPPSALLDAVGYLDAATADEPTEGGAVAPGGPVSEAAWLLTARAARHLGIRSTLTLPVLEEDRVVAELVLYGSSTGAFADRRDALAGLCGAWAPGAVTNADLGFESRLVAAAAPDRILDRRDLDTAAGLVAHLRGVAPEAVVDQVVTTAAHVGVTPGELARFVLEAHAADLEPD